MKNYLNKQERNDLIMVQAIIGYINIAFEKWYERGNITKEELKYIRMARSLIKKAISGVRSRQDKDFNNKLKRDIDNIELLCLPKTKAQVMLEQYEKDKEEEMCLVHRQTLELMAEKALGNCDPCAEDHTKCKLREAFIELNIPVFDPYSTTCPYMLSKSKKAC